MKRAALLAVVLALLGVSGAGAQSVFTGKQARAVFLRAEPDGRFHGCRREAARELLCRVEVRQVAIHEWLDPATGQWQEENRAEWWVPAWVPIRPGGINWLAAR